MGFLRRLFRGGEGALEGGEGDSGAEAREQADSEEPMVAATSDASERDHELEVLREEQGRLDELQERQLRYARYAWQPPAEGGERRADDADEARGDG